MISIKDRKILGQIFSHYDYVMTTAQLSKEKLYYRDVQRMLEAGLIERIKRGYDTLVRNGLQHFDSWASTFGETITALELAPEGYNLVGR